MKNKSKVLNVVFWFFLVLAISFSLLELYISYKFYSFRFPGENLDDNLKKFLLASRDLVSSVKKILSFFWRPLFVLTLYFTLKHFNVLKRKKKYFIFYVLFVVSIMFTIYAKIRNTNNINSPIECFFISFVNYFESFLSYLIFPILVCTVKCSISYFLCDESEKNNKIKMLKQKIFKLKKELEKNNLLTNEVKPNE